MLIILILVKLKSKHKIVFYIYYSRIWRYNGKTGIVSCLLKYDLRSLNLYALSQISYPSALLYNKKNRYMTQMIHISNAFYMKQYFFQTLLNEVKFSITKEVNMVAIKHHK